MPQLESSDSEKLWAEIEALKTENAALKEMSARNAAKISKDRHQRRNGEMAIYVILGILAVLAIGYKRQSEGTWSWGVSAEITLALIGAGSGAIYKMMEDPDQD